MVFIVSLLGAIICLAIVFGGKIKQANFSITITALILLGVAAYQTISIIPAGHVGVVDFFGKVSPVTLKAGVNIRNPFARVILFSIKTQETAEEMNVPSKEGLTVSLDASVLFHLDPDKVSSVYKTVGRNYVNVVLIPQFRSITRSVTAQYEAKALYTEGREVVAAAILEELNKLVGPRGIIVETVPLRQIKLPTRLSQSIEQKLQMEQESQRMEFVLLKEQQEAERKRVEAQGIADFQEIVTQGINENLLRWKGIEATEKLANSPNSKMVIVGGKDGLPLILNQ